MGASSVDAGSASMGSVGARGGARDGARGGGGPMEPFVLRELLAAFWASWCGLDDEDMLCKGWSNDNFTVFT